MLDQIARREHLRRIGFKKNDPRRCKHPPGRPPTIKCIPDILRRLGAEAPPASLLKPGERPEDNPTYLDLVLRRVMQAAAVPESWAVEFVAERTEGRVPNVTKLTLGNSLASLAEEELLRQRRELEELLKDEA